MKEHRYVKKYRTETIDAKNIGLSIHQAAAALLLK